MSRIIENIQSAIQPYWLLIVVVVSVVVLGVLGYYSYTRYSGGTKHVSFEDPANEDSSGSTITIFFYHVDWCPHCKTAMPEWKEFSEKYDGQTVNGHIIQCVDLDCTDDASPTIKQALATDKVDSFPTIKAKMMDESGKEKTIAYEARMTANNMNKFVETISLGKSA